MPTFAVTLKHLEKFAGISGFSGAGGYFGGSAFDSKTANNGVFTEKNECNQCYHYPVILVQ